jgi:transposase-like protein
LSLANTVRLLAFLGVDRCRTTVHNCVQKADREPAGGCAPGQIALDETVIKVNGERF